MDPVLLRGSLTFPDQSVQAFVGWLELANAIETLHRNLAQSAQALRTDVTPGIADSSVTIAELPTRPAGFPPAILPHDGNR